MTFSYIKVEREGALTLVTLARPQSYNALNAEAHEELAAAFDDFERDDSQWVAIVTGEGDKAFCAGHDLKQQAAGGGLVLPPSGFAGLTSRFAMDKPVIAAVNGLAFGGGFEIALACDLVIAAEHAQFALPEPKIGLSALAGGMQRLTVQIGSKRAMALLLTGRRLSAREGLDYGFVNEVAPPGELLNVARKWAQEILECAPLAVRATKRGAMQALAMSLPEAIASYHDEPAVKTMMGSQDATEGPAAFVAKRKPIWTGK